MANKQQPKGKPKVAATAKTATMASAGPAKSFSIKNMLTSNDGINAYLPGILVFVAFLLIALCIFKDYGVSFDEPELRDMGVYSFDYIFHGDKKLFAAVSDHHGAGFQLFLVLIEKMLGLTDTRDIFLMRHLATHIVFLLSGFCFYLLLLNLYKNKLLATFGYVALILSPRLYAHSFFNGGDIPFLSTFLVAMTVCYFAFKKNNKWLFLLLGVACGFSTGVRIMGIFLALFVGLFIVADMITDGKNKNKVRDGLVNCALFLAGFCGMLLLSWPYLWKSPVSYFAESLTAFSHYPWNGYILLNGQRFTGGTIPWSYFPLWFLITVPELWLLAGIGGIVLFTVSFFKKPATFIKNTDERNLLLYMLCFFGPVLSVIVLHSVVYNDWRHLYFVYPSFLLIALYFVNWLLHTKYTRVVQGACLLQLAVVGFFMVANHPFQQVYFNNFVSHADGYLHKNYEMDYWGSSYKQAIDHLLAGDDTKTIKINCYFRKVLENNIKLLPEDQRNRVKYAEVDNADYYMTNFWSDFYQFPMPNIAYTIQVLNSPIVCVYKVEKDAASQNTYREVKKTALRKMIATDPSNADAYSKMGNVYFTAGNLDSAEAYFAKAADLSPGNTDLLNNLAAVYGSERKLPQAIAVYKRSIAINPHNAAPYTNIALSYLLSSNSDSAVYYLHQAINVNSSFNLSYEMLANAYSAAGKQDRQRSMKILRKEIIPLLNCDHDNTPK